MSLLIITGDGPEHRYVANRISQAHSVACIVIDAHRRRRFWRTLHRTNPLAVLDKLLWRLFLSAVGDAAARREALHDVLDRELCSKFLQPEKVVRVRRDFGPSLKQIVADYSPDVIAVYGTSIIPDEVLSLARVVALNMHTGLSPLYRGTSCAFWPIYDSRPEYVGATVHACTSVVDGGQIYATRRAQLFRTDDLHRVFARAVSVGTDAYIEVLGDALNGQLTGTPQDLTAGREYKGSMRGFRAELLARFRLLRMRRRWPNAPGHAADRDSAA